MKAGWIGSDKERKYTRQDTKCAFKKELPGRTYSRVIVPEVDWHFAGTGKLGDVQLVEVAIKISGVQTPGG